MALGALILAQGSAWGAAQSTQANPNAGRPPSARATVLPLKCLVQKRASQQVNELLQAIKDHPTAGAYNTLGVLYAEHGQINCALAALHQALTLDNRNWEAHYNLGLALLKKGERTAAAQELRAAISVKPDSASAHYALGMLLQSEKQLDAAGREFQAVLTIDPRFAPAALGLAQVLTAQGKPAAAAACLEKAVEQSPPAPELEQLNVALASAYVQSGQADKAQQTLTSFLAAHPESAAGHYCLGTIYAQTESANPNAIEEFRKALQLDPHQAAARIALARALLAQHQYTELLTVLKTYPEPSARDDTGHYLAGMAYSGLKQWDQAIAELGAAERINSNDAEVRYQLAMALEHLGRIAGAVRELQAAEALNPTDADVHQQLARLLRQEHFEPQAREESARVAALKAKGNQHSEAQELNRKANDYLASGDVKAAIETYRQALQLVPRDPQLRYNLALALDRVGDRARERQELNEVIRLDANLAVAHDQLGLLALQDGQQADAEREFEAALAINPQDAEAENDLGVLYSQQGNDARAAAMFHKAIESDPQYSKACVNLGLTLARHGQFPQAEEQFQQAIQIDPRNAAAYTAMGMLQGKTGRGAAAVQSFRHVVELQPDSADAHLNLGIALVDQYDRVNGFKQFSEAKRLNPNDAAVRYNLGRFYFETGKYDQARQELQTACRLQPDYSSALYFLALTERQTDHLKHSTELLAKVVALQPGNADAQFLLGQNLQREGNQAEAIAHWKAAIQADPNHSQALYNLARALSRIHDPEATQYQQRFDALQKSQQLSDRVDQLGNFALEAANAQNWPQAVEQMGEAIRLCGQCVQSAHLHRNLGLFYFRTGKVEQAERELRTAVTLDPDDVDAKNALAVLERLHTAQK